MTRRASGRLMCLANGCFDWFMAGFVRFYEVL